MILRFRLRQWLVWHLHTTLSVPIAFAIVTAGATLRKVGLRRLGLVVLLKGRRIGNMPKADFLIRDILASADDGSYEFRGLLGPVPAVPVASYSIRTLILKVPTIANGEVVEKGALVIKFSETFGALLRLVDMRALSEYFRIILEPSWVGYALPEILAWSQLSPERVVVMAPYSPDCDLITRLNSNLVPTTIGSADWASPTTFSILDDTEKVYDCIYVANYKPTKRVDRFVRAVVNVTQSNPEFRALLVCAGLGKNVWGSEILATIEWGMANSNLEFKDGVNQSNLNILFNQSKVNVLVSLREGANKGLAEGLFAGVPALLIAESACGNHRHINSETGLVVADSELEAALERFAKDHSCYQARTWADAHISPNVSSQRLSAEVRDIEISEGRQWAHELIPKANQPEMRYLSNEHDWLLDVRAPLLEMFAKERFSEPSAQAFIAYLSHENDARQAVLRESSPTDVTISPTQTA